MYDSVNSNHPSAGRNSFVTSHEYRVSLASENNYVIADSVFPNGLFRLLGEKTMALKSEMETYIEFWAWKNLAMHLL